MERRDGIKDLRNMMLGEGVEGSLVQQLFRPKVSLALFGCKMPIVL